MKRTLDASWPWSALIGVLLPASRAWLESDMARHMLLQFPLLLIVGAGFANTLPTTWRKVVATFNAHGANGLLLASLVLGFWMLPRALDDAVLSPPVALAKYASLLLAGMALRLSWRAAGTVVQLFFVGNWAWMSATVGLLYQSLPQRLCSVYLSDQQVVAGQGLVIMALLVPIAWLSFSGARGELIGDEAAPHLPTRADA